MNTFLTLIVTDIFYAKVQYNFNVLCASATSVKVKKFMYMSKAVRMNEYYFNIYLLYTK